MEKIKELLHFIESPSSGIQSFEILPLEKPTTIEHYKNWLHENLHGEMHYLQEHLDFKENPRSLKPDLKSAMVMTFPYYPHPEKIADPFPTLRKALYAQGHDYHYWIKQRMQPVLQNLRDMHPDHLFVVATDSAPVLERDLAARAGLGWFGKNTCLIHPKHGSLFFIAEILSSLPTDAFRKTFGKPSWSESPAVQIQDFCGTCNRCMEACPTGAIESPRKLNATKCISYLTIESKSEPPADLRAKMGDWFFGCDICQTVCPWNEKAFEVRKKPELRQRDFNTSANLNLSEEEKSRLTSEIDEILSLSGKQLLKKIKGTPLERAGYKGLRRNAAQLKSRFSTDFQQSF